MSRYSTFKNRTAAEKDSEISQRSRFISDSTSSYEVYHLESDDYKTVVITKDHREGMDQTILFTYPNEDIPVEQGHYIEHNNRNYLVFMEYKHSAEEFYKKFKLVECNGTIKKEGKEDLPAAYFGSLRSFMSLTSTDTDGLNFSESTENPVVLASDRDFLRKDYRFMFMGDIYKILTVDDKSNPGIAYLSIKIVPYNENVDTSEKAGKIPAADTYSSEVLYEGELHTFDTYRGYFDSDVNVEISKRTSNSVTIRVPYDINSLKVFLKDSDGNIVENNYEVVV